MSPHNCNEILSPSQDGDDESERVQRVKVIENAAPAAFERAPGLGELVWNSSDFALGSVCTQDWKAVEGAASYVAQETAKQV